MSESKTYWAEIRCNYMDDTDRFWRVDAWKTENDDEEGKVIAYIDDIRGRVLYIDPLASVDETVKEYALLDGAFIINGDGVIESAGSLIQTDEYVHLPSGLGTRHAAAVAISKAVDCIAVTVSSSTRQVCLFRKGVMLPLFTKGFGYGNAT